VIFDRRSRRGLFLTSVLWATLAWLPVMPPGCFAADIDNIPQLQAAADKGFIPQEIELAAAYFTGKGVTQDVRMAAHWYERAAESGDPEAENEIGFLYQTGVGVPADAARALHWYQLAASSGYVKARVNLGVLYFWGIGVAKNHDLAARYFRDAFAKGSGAAASYLGDMYYFGIGVERDAATAERWYTSGAKLHDPLASYDLGTLFSVAPDHAHDFAKASVLLRGAASDGYVPAMHSLGLLLIRHPELARSANEARALIQDASAAGSWRSSVVLGVFERDGGDGAANPEAAYYDFRLAVLQGGDEAGQMLGNDFAALEKKLSADQMTAIDERAGNWHKEHPLALSFVYRSGGDFRRFPSLARSMAENGIHAGLLIAPPPT